MRQTKLTLSILAASIALIACGGSGGGSSTASSSGDQTLKAKYSMQVSFGDSLSDVGTYAVGTVKALSGGKFTINGDNTSVNPAMTGKNWTELMAAQFGLPAPCPAQTGLDGDASKGFSVPVVNHPGCYGYAQGGARVTNPVGPHNKLTGSALGALTVPVASQIQTHLNVIGGKFKGDEIVFVMAGGNDALFQLSVLSNAATAAGQAAGAAEGAKVGAATFASTLVASLAAGATNPQTAAQAIALALGTENARPGHTDQSVVGAAVTAAAMQAGNQAVASPAVYGPLVAKAQAAATDAGNAAGKTAGAAAGAAYLAANSSKAVVAMSTAGAELVALVKTQLLAKGATRVVVNNLPDLGTTPAGLSKPAEIQTLINLMVSSFNQQLASGLASENNVVLVDTFAISHDQATNPKPYGLSNVTTPACDLNSPKNPLGTALTCNASNLVAGDVSHYSFADDVHPTPFLYWLLARYVSERMVVKGWM